MAFCAPPPELTPQLVNQSFEFGAFRVYGSATWEKGAWFSNGDRAYQFRQGGGDEYLTLLGPNGEDTFASDSFLDFYTRLSAYDKAGQHPAD